MLEEQFSLYGVGKTEEVKFVSDVGIVLILPKNSFMFTPRHAEVLGELLKKIEAFETEFYE